MKGFTAICLSANFTTEQKPPRGGFFGINNFFLSILSVSGEFFYEKNLCRRLYAVFFVFTYLLYVNKVAFSPAVNYCYCRRPGSLISKLYDFEREYYPYEKSLELVKCLVEKKGITDAAIVANLNTMVCDFANRAINAIYHSSDFRYAMRMELLKRIDLLFLGSYMYAGNFKEKITKWIISCRLYWLYDMFRTLRRKI